MSESESNPALPSVARPQPADLQAEERRLLELAVGFHVGIEGEYGCPGATCPGVQRLIEKLRALKGVGRFDYHPEPSPLDSREALRCHIAAIDGRRPLDGHSERGFGTCPHPDCVAAQPWNRVPSSAAIDAMHIADEIAARNCENEREAARVRPPLDPKRHDAMKFLALLLSPCDDGADTHTWTTCPRCLAMSELQDRAPLARRFVMTAIEALK